MSHEQQPQQERMTISCRFCGKDDSTVTFSKRQRKLAAKGEAKCTDCIQQHQENSTPNHAASKSQDESESPRSKRPNADEASAAANTAETSNDLDRPVPKKARRKRPRLEDSDDDDSEDDTRNGECETPDVSLNALKRSILGRDFEGESGTPAGTNKSEDQDLLEIKHLFHQSTTAASPKPSSHAGLQAELQCAICQELCYPPVSLHCGHSFCQECLAWWWKTSPTCPTCRTSFAVGRTPNTMPSVNVALKKCVVVLFGAQLVDRIQSRKRMTMGEAGGAHSRGYEVLSPLADEFWHSVRSRRGAAASGFGGSSRTPNGGTIKARRNIVLDANDQRMQIALALRQPPYQTENGLHLWITLLMMEEDEAGDSGFPVMIQNVEDEHFICANEDRFAFSSLGIQMAKENGAKAPVGRVAKPTSDGDFVYRFEADTCSNHHEARSLHFLHEETGAILELDLSLLKSGASGGTFRPLEEQGRNQRTTSTSFIMEDEDEEEYEHGHDVHQHDHDEEEGEDLDQFENDGFLVGDGDDSSEMEGAFSEDENDVCHICKDGGELMICDGGKEMDGCGKSFHYTCTGRSALPEGDWICSECAISGGISVKDKEGHEFVTRPKGAFAAGDEEPRASAKGKSGRTLEDDSDDEDDELNTAKIEGTDLGATDSSLPKTKQRRIIEDSSEDEEHFV